MSKVLLVAGMGYGDEGKGSIVDFLCREQKAGLVVRYNGGAQAAHNVVLDDGRHHTFSQFGSGTFNAGCRTHLSRFMLVNPVSMESEEKHLATLGITDAYARMTVEREAFVTTPFHVALNRMREMSRGDGLHGSCGMGIGETMADSLAYPHDMLRVGDLDHEPTMWRKLTYTQDRMREKAREIVNGLTGSRPDSFYKEWDLIGDTDTVSCCIPYYKRFHERVRFVDNDYLAAVLRDSVTVFEGAQGVLLDQDFGFQPYTTWTDCTFGNALKLIDGFDGLVERLGVLRAYMTRHGAGPFVSESRAFDKCSEGDHNGLGAWQGTFRSGAFDFVATDYALNVIQGVDGLAFTHIDRINLLTEPHGSFGAKGIPTCLAYDVKKAFENMDPLPGHTNRLDVVRPVDLDHQAKVAEALFRVKPRIETFLGTDIEYVTNIAGLLKVPVKITSHGPRASDKRRIEG